MDKLSIRVPSVPPIRPTTSSGIPKSSPSSLEPNTGTAAAGAAAFAAVEPHPSFHALVASCTAGFHFVTIYLKLSFFLSLLMAAEKHATIDANWYWSPFQAKIPVYWF